MASQAWPKGMILVAAKHSMDPCTTTMPCCVSWMVSSSQPPGGPWGGIRVGTQQTCQAPELLLVLAGSEE
jgi:hypothetical protein